MHRTAFISTTVLAATLSSQRAATPFINPVSQRSIASFSPHPIRNTTSVNMAMTNPHTLPRESTPLLVNSSPSQQPEQDPIDWNHVWEITSRYIVPNTVKSRLLSLLTMLAVLLRRSCSLLRPFAYKLAVDALAKAIVPGTQLAVPYTAVALYVIAQIGSTVFSAVQDAGYAFTSSDYQKRFSVDLFAHLQSLSLAYHMHRKTGEVIKVMDRAEGSIDTLTTTILFTLIPTLGETLVVTGIFFHLGTPFIALTVFITVVAYLYFTISITKWRIKLRRMVIEANNKVSEKAVDALINYETVKMFGMETEETAEYEELRNQFQNRYIWLKISLSSLNSGQSVIRVLGGGVAMLLAAIGAAQGNLSPGDFVLVNAYVMQLFQPLLFLGSSYRMFMQAVTDLEKAITIFKTNPTVQDVPGAKTLKMSEEDVVAGRVGEVRFENVTFLYDTKGAPGSGGIRNVDFCVQPGKILAIVGKTGVGKSTIMRLLLRFYDVSSGKVSIDGEDIRSFTQQSLRKNMGVVAQDTILFNNTLRQNIAYGKKDAQDVEIYEAGRSAALGPLLDSLPAGLDTVVGERGIRLSGGERQRVGSARCIIKHPSVVLLDEASSSLDTHTEKEMQTNLREICRNRTTIIIAHRLSTVMMADEIIVLGKGEKDQCGTVVEKGSHTELLKLNGVYASMWEAQTTVSDTENGL